MRTLVALDLETTGLDPARDAIIEIGALRFRGARLERTFSKLVNPGRPIPPFITQLTGIDDNMVADAPRLTAVLDELGELIGDAPVIGHNVAFDLSFLQRRGLLGDALPIDTYDLASVMLPTVGRYGLAAIARQLGVPVPSSHRALPDAQTTRQVFLKLVDKARELPQAVLEEIVLLGENVEWGGGWLFEEALSERHPKAAPSPLSPGQLLRPIGEEPGPVLHPRDVPLPLDIEELASTLEPGGPFAQRFQGYEHRTEQVSMLRAVAQALSDGKHLMVEAGTGTGKSMAYLIPALDWATRNGQRVVVSTNTINLQDQLRNKDVPDLCQALGQEYRVAVLKGRANYLCPRRLDAARHLGPRSPEEMRLLAKLLVWLSEGGSGDRTEISLSGPAEAASWSRLSAESDECTPEACQSYADGICPYFHARRTSERAHLVIVNHALLLADIATGSRVIPEYEYLIVDEAHHLESAVTKGMSLQVTEAELNRALAEISGPHAGLLAMARTEFKRLGRDPSGTVFQSAIRACSDDAAAARDLVTRLFAATSSFMADRREGQEISPFGQQERILPSTRTLTTWSEVERVWEELRRFLTGLAQNLADLSQVLEDNLAGQSDLEEDLVVSLRTSSRTVASVLASLDSFVFEPDSQTIYWIEIQPSGSRVSLNAAPLEVGPLVQRHLWHAKSCVVMTSATLTTAGSFDYLRGRLKADEADELAVDSPFDYENSTLLYLVNDIPEPTDRQSYQRVLEQGLIGLGRASRGRMLVLFTSHDQLRRTAGAITAPLAGDGILVFDQTEGASRYALLEQFRTTEQAVLLGTRSFWEGVDVPGQALSVLAIARLPFDVPTDPIIAARAESFDSPFDEYHVPEAILRFRQGFGRLIRSRSDRGVVVCLDRRILSKRYGQAFLRSLPRCTQRVGPMADLPRAAARWLGS